LNAEVIKVLRSGQRLLLFDRQGPDFYEAVKKIGRMPLPPYIKGYDADPERYQTVYSKNEGSAAAPTAGLHFTREYLSELRARGVAQAYLTLHIGTGTFAPVKTESIEDHKMHSEFYSVGGEAAEAVNRVKKARTGAVDARPPKVVCVGTTSLRTLESLAGADGSIRADEGQTDLFIYPGYKFKCADALLTNFHLPGSTLLMLVCAFAGYDLAMEAYRQAVEAEFRFYSFGDVMIVL